MTAIWTQVLLMVLGELLVIDYFTEHYIFILRLCVCHCHNYINYIKGYFTWLDLFFSADLIRDTVCAAACGGGMSARRSVCMQWEARRRLLCRISCVNTWRSVTWPLYSETVTRLCSDQLVTRTFQSSDRCRVYSTTFSVPFSFLSSVSSLLYIDIYWRVIINS